MLLDNSAVSEPMAGLPSASASSCQALCDALLRSFSDSGQGVFVIEGGRVTYLNPVAADLTGWTIEDAFGLPVASVFRVIEEALDDAHSCSGLDILREITGEGRDEKFMRLVSRDGRCRSIAYSCTPLHARAGEAAGMVLVFRDVTKERARINRIAYEARHDALTGLLNRLEFERAISKTLRTEHAAEEPHALLYLDFDNFKPVNDTCGHLAGDELLRRLSRLLQSRMRRSDILARLGGDEFGILLEKCPLDRADVIARSLVEAVKRFNFVWDGKFFSVGLSIGLVEINGEYRDLKHLLNAADAACYMAKRSGRNRVHISVDRDPACLR